MAKASSFSPDSVIGANILRALRNCPNEDVAPLRRDRMISRTKLDPVLSSKSLRYRGMEAYSQVSGFPLCYFFFRTHIPPTPSYTPYDEEMIALLNVLPETHLTALKKALRVYFYNPLMDCTENTPNKRSHALVKSHLHDDELNFGDGDGPGMSDELVQALKLSYERHYFFAQADVIAELASFSKVSLYWFFDFHTQPLFCRTALADEVFATYTLIQPCQRSTFLDVVRTVAANLRIF